MRESLYSPFAYQPSGVPAPSTSSDALGWPAAFDKGDLVIAVRNRKNKSRVSVPKVAETQNVKEAPLEVIGSIKQVFPSATFSVELDNGHVVLGHIAGRLRRHRIRILPGDRVDLELSPYDLTKGRIVYRYRAGEERRAPRTERT